MIDTQTELIDIVTKEVNTATDPTTFAPVVEQLADVQEHLAGLMTQEADSGLASDPAFLADLASLVNDQGALASLMTKVGGNGPAA